MSAMPSFLFLGFRGRLFMRSFIFVLSLVATNFGIAFTSPILNAQDSSTIDVYKSPT